MVSYHCRGAAENKSRGFIHMMKKLLALVCVLAIALSCWTAFASEKEPGVVEGVSYVSDALHGASALYVSGESVTLDNASFYGRGYADDADKSQLASIPNKYGLCAVVLGAGLGTDIVLNNPTIESDPESYANGVFAAGMAKITVNGGTITTNNDGGHGIDATYMAKVYAYDTVIRTGGGTSGALATDFGGGFITGERLDCATQNGSAPGIFCAGSTIIMLKDSKLYTETATGIVVAHDHSVVVLDNCEVDAAGAAISGLQAFGNSGSTAYVFGGKLTSRGGAVVGQGGGITDVYLIGADCTAGGETAISNNSGTLAVYLWDTELVGNVEAKEGTTTVINIYAGAKLTGDVKGDGNVVINLYDGGEYNGNFAVDEPGEGEAAPEKGDFDYYLVNYWASGSTWDASVSKTYVTSVEPDILANSAKVIVAEGAASQTYSTDVYDPSENGVDPSLLNIGGAYGFSTMDVFGGDGASDGDAASGGESAGALGEGEDGGASDGASGGESSGAPTDGEGGDGASDGASAGAPAEGDGASDGDSAGDAQPPENP